MENCLRLYRDVYTHIYIYISLRKVDPWGELHLNTGEQHGKMELKRKLEF